MLGNRLFIAGIQDVIGWEKLSATPVFYFFPTAVEIIRKKPGTTFAEHIQMPQKSLKPALGNS